MRARSLRIALLLSLATLAACATPAPAPRPNVPVGAARPAPQLIWQDPPLQCVPFARGRSGIGIWGDAQTWWGQAAGKYPRSQRPAPGAVLALNGYGGNPYGHVAVVTAVLSPREILVDHANWHNRGEIALNAPVRDESPAGDWSQVRVYNLVAQDWGARIYTVQGFIHPG